MLIALNIESGDSAEKVGVELAQHLGGSINVYEPLTFEDYNEKIKQYKTKKNEHLIITKSHQRWTRDKDVATQRLADIALQHKGGAIWGADLIPGSSAYVHGYEDMARVALEAGYNHTRNFIYKPLLTTYFGRTDYDPRLLIVGFKPTYPAVNKLSKFILESFPEDEWSNVAYTRSSKSAGLSKTLDRLEDIANIVSVGEDAHRTLTELGIDHGALPSVNDLHKMKAPDLSRRVGIVIRETGKTNADNRNWTL